VDILLQETDSQGEYAIPFQYVMEDDCLCRFSAMSKYEDDGDMVIINSGLNNNHISKRGRVWIPLLDIANIPLRSKDAAHTIYNCLSIFLKNYPFDGESGLKQKVESLLDSILMDNARKEYTLFLQDAMKGKLSRVFLDTVVTLPDPKILEAELASLEHFKVFKPNGDEKYPQEKYHLDIDWEALGFKFSPIIFDMNSPLFPDLG